MSYTFSPNQLYTYISPYFLLKGHWHAARHPSSHDVQTESSLSFTYATTQCLYIEIQRIKIVTDQRNNRYLQLTSYNLWFRNNRHTENILSTSSCAPSHLDWFSFIDFDHHWLHTVKVKTKHKIMHIKIITLIFLK